MSVEQLARNASPTPDEIAYAAGFFDGEGHVRIQKHSQRCRTFMLSVSVVQATQWPLDLFKQWFGGTISSRTIKKGGRPSALYTWQASSAVAERFLKSVYPHLRVKKDEADIALNFRSTFRPQHVRGGHKRMSESEIDARLSMSLALQALRQTKRATALRMLERDRPCKSEF